MRAALFAALCIAAGWAMADQAVVKVYSLSVQERLENLELIDITAEKTPAKDQASLEQELTEILLEVEDMERSLEEEHQ